MKYSFAKLFGEFQLKLLHLLYVPVHILYVCNMKLLSYKLCMFYIVCSVSFPDKLLKEEIQIFLIFSLNLRKISTGEWFTVNTEYFQNRICRYLEVRYIKVFTYRSLEDTPKVKADRAQILWRHP